MYRCVPTLQGQIQDLAEGPRTFSEAPEVSNIFFSLLTNLGSRRLGGGPQDSLSICHCSRFPIPFVLAPHPSDSLSLTLDLMIALHQAIVDQSALREASSPWQSGEDPE